MGRARDRASADLNGQEFILDADADTSISADTDDQIDIKIAGADDFQFTANTFTAQSGSTIAAQALTATTVTATGDVSLDGGSFVFNESSADKDFRVESNGNTHMLFVDGGNNGVGIGTSSVDTSATMTVSNTSDAHGITIVGALNKSRMHFQGANTGSASTDGLVIGLSSSDDTNDDSALIGLKESGSLTLQTSGTNHLIIDGNGIVTMPKQPCFRATRTNTAGTTQGFTSNITFDSEDLDLNADYDTSNGRFTAPVDGTYYFTHAGLGASGSSASTHNSGASWHLEFLKNGTRTGFQFYWYQGNPTAGGTQPQYINSYIDMVITLSSGDYITIQLPDGTDSYYSDTSGYYKPYFQGFLIA